MSIDEPQVREAVAAVTDPELRRPLGELGMVGAVGVKRKRVAVDIALPVGHYPQVDELVGRVRLAVSALAGVDEVVVEQTLMGEEDRARLRMLLRGEPFEGAAPGAAGVHTITADTITVPPSVTRKGVRIDSCSQG